MVHFYYGFAIFRLGYEPWASPRSTVTKGSKFLPLGTDDQRREILVSRFHEEIHKNDSRWLYRGVRAATLNGQISLDRR